MEKAEKYYVYYGEGEEEGFPDNIEHYVNQTSPTDYSPRLAHILTAFSYSVYDEENVKRSLESFGFENFCSDYDNTLIGYTIGKKQMSDGRTLVLVCVRGSTGTTEWMSNFNLSETTVMDGVSLHTGFWEAASTVYDGLDAFLGGSWDNTLYVFTGHSRGAAAANILARYLLLHNGVEQSCIYDYNIACPDVARGSDSDWNPDGAYDNIFNIANVKDMVSLIPGALGDALFAKGENNWGKFGRSYWFVENDGDIEINPATHDPAVYLDCLRNEYPLAEYRSRDSLDLERTNKVTDFRSSFARPPLDIEITGVSGEKLVNVTNGETKYYDSSLEDKDAAADPLSLLRQLKPTGIEIHSRDEEGKVRPTLSISVEERTLSAGRKKPRKQDPRRKEPKQKLMSEKENYQKRAAELFSNSSVHYNCAQSVLMVFAEDCGISEEKACQLGRNFGSGMKMGGCCGAITGGLMVIGMMDGAEKEYSSFMEDMRSKHENLVNCSDLLRSSDSANQCDRLVSDAVSAVIDAFG